jgi:hypothetical protein
MKPSPSYQLRTQNAQINPFRQEAINDWKLHGSTRQFWYISARLQGLSPEQAIQKARGKRWADSK